MTYKKFLYAVLAAFCAAASACVFAPSVARAENSLPIVVQTDGSISAGTGSKCNNGCMNIVFGSQVFTPTVSADLASLEVFTSDFGTMSRNPDTNGCFIYLYNEDTGEMIGQSENAFTGYSCAGDLVFTFPASQPHLQAGTRYRWDFLFGTQNFTGLTFLGSPFDTVGGSFNLPPIVNAKFIAWAAAPVPVKEPIVIVPGIMGSVLSRSSGDAEVWPGVSQMLVPGADHYLDDLALSPNGTQIVGKEMNASSVIEAELGVPFYKNLLDTLRGDGYEDGVNLFAAPYDWRVDIAQAANTLRAKIAQAVAASPNGKINVVAHSMGGVLVKQFLANATDTAFLDKLVLAGVPQTGSPKAFKILNYGDSPVTFGPVEILNAQEVKSIAQNMPAVYELLPSERYVQVAGGYVQDFRGGGNKILSYADTTAFMENNASGSRNAALLNVADAFHEALDAQAVRAPDVYNIVGCLTPTISGFNLYDDGFMSVVRNSGDGTVPEVSAMNLANDFKNYFVLGNETGIDHNGLVTDVRPLTLIKNIIDDDAGTAALPDGISASTADCLTPRTNAENITTIEFSTHSPVTLNLYDPVGRHTGPLPNGDIELGIPGSTYDAVGENSFITVPAFATYQLIAQGTAPGSFTLQARGYAGSAVTESASYLSVPIQGVGAKAELDFSGFNGDLGLKVDNNADGVLETIVQPSAVLSAASSSDVIPPSLVIAFPTSTEYVRTSTLPIRIDASDAGSGVGLVQVLLDGVPTTSTAIDFSALELGPHTLSVRVIDNAGNPVSAQSTFSIVATPSSTVEDVDRFWKRGFIIRKDVRDALKAWLQKLVVKVRGMRSINRVAGRLLLGELSLWHNRKIIDNTGYRALRGDIQWLLNKGPGK